MVSLIKGMPHDSLFRANLEDLRVSFDVIMQCLPKIYKQNCDCRKIVLEASTFINLFLQQSASDIVLSIPFNTEDNTKVFILIEHQSSEPKDMPWRMLQYSISIIERHLLQYGVRPHVVPILLYQGSGTPYKGDMNVQDGFVPKALPPTIQTQDIILIDLSVMDDDEILKYGRAAPMMLAMKYARQKPDFDKVMDKMVPVLSKLTDSLKHQLVFYISEQWGYDQQVLMQTLSKHLVESGGKMTSLADILRAEIRAEISDQEQEKGFQRSQQELQQSQQELQQSQQENERQARKISKLEQENERQAHKMSQMEQENERQTRKIFQLEQMIKELRHTQLAH